MPGLRGRGTVNPMLPSNYFSLPPEVEVIAAGEVLRRRNEVLTSVLHLESGRVLRGVLDDGYLRHQLGALEGPFWLDAASALMGLPLPVDMVADTRVQIRRLPIEEFRRSLAEMPAGARGLLLDMAHGFRQQSELAVSRLAQDAESRCAQWLLKHAQPDHSGAMQVTLHQRKRLIAAQLGIAPETFSRVLRHLRELGLIHGTGNVLNLPQPRALQSMAGC
jgi:CRP-like cAMP-binding protein